MNSPPLEAWFTGSLPGGSVSAATSFGPGTAALRSPRGGRRGGGARRERGGPGERRAFEEFAPVGARQIAGRGHGRLLARPSCAFSSCFGRRIAPRPHGRQGTDAEGGPCARGNSTSPRLRGEA